MITKIIIIEDDVQLSQFLKELIHSSLEAETVVFNTGTQALKYISSNKPDLVLVDLFLDDIHGKTICETIRKTYADVPIIVLTGDKSPDSVIACLNAGADDYITKPFNSDELVARISSKIRNLLSTSSSLELTYKDLKLNLETIEVHKGEERLDFTSTEFKLLHYLILNKFRVCTRDKILFSVWGYSSEVDTRVVDVHIGKLRKKIETGKEVYINTIRAYGYRMAEE